MALIGIKKLNTETTAEYLERLGNPDYQVTCWFYFKNCWKRNTETGEVRSLAPRRVNEYIITTTTGHRAHITQQAAKALGINSEREYD